VPKSVAVGTTHRQKNRELSKSAEFALSALCPRVDAVNRTERWRSADAIVAASSQLKIDLSPPEKLQLVKDHWDDVAASRYFANHRATVHG
jgi:hypothetical protein